MRALLFPLHAAVTTLKMARDTIANGLWRLKCLWRDWGCCFRCYCYRTRNCLVFNHANCPQIEHKSPVSSVLCNNTFVWIWIFLSSFIWKTSIGTIWTLERFGRSSYQLCAK